MKKLIVISASVGAGAVLVAALILGGVLWYHSRPENPRRWDTKALKCIDDAAGFDTTGADEHIRLVYTVENTTEIDYSIVSCENCKLLASGDSGLSRPLPGDVLSLTLPVFIPAKQKAVIWLESGVRFPTTAGDTEDVHHEKLRGYLDEHWGMATKGFMLFDSVNRYQLLLPKWKARKQK